MRLLGAGFNAHGQLNGTKDDLYDLTLISQDVNRLCLATWSTTVWASPGSITMQGHQEQTITTSIADTAQCFVGDHNGFLGMLEEGKLVRVEAGEDSQALILRCLATNASPSLEHIATARNGVTIAVHLRSDLADGPRVSQRICEFPSYAAFRSWCLDPFPPENQPRTEHSFKHPIKQLVAGSTSFALLTAEGEVYTWGEARRCALGRSTVDTDGLSTAERPGFVAALGGISIKSICHGGWMFGAVSQDGAAYLWGLDMPQAESGINTLANMPADDEVALIELANGEDEPEVVDMAIGEGHVALITSTGELYVAGSNSNGQLGLGAAVEAAADWRRVQSVSDAVSVHCGPITTLVLAR